MKNYIINKFVAITIIAALSISFAAAYSDVTENAWYYTAIEEATSSGFMHGYPDGTFRPNQAVTRAECAKILGTLDEHPEECGFVDNKDWNAWYHNDVMMHGALMGGIYRDESVPVTGQFMTMYFYPQESCIREDFALGLYNVLNLNEYSWKAHFKDLDEVSWGEYDWENYRQAVCAMRNTGLMVGSSTYNDDGYFHPKKTLTRAEVAQIFYNYKYNYDF